MNLEEYKEKKRNGERVSAGAMRYFSSAIGFTVTSCWRESSSMESRSWYEEIFVWKSDGKGNREMIEDATGRDFWEVCQQIERDGDWRTEP